MIKCKNIIELRKRFEKFVWPADIDGYYGAYMREFMITVESRDGKGKKKYIDLLTDILEREMDSERRREIKYLIWEIKHFK